MEEMELKVFKETLQTINEQCRIPVDNLPTPPPSPITNRMTQTLSPFLKDDIKDYMKPMKSNKKN